MSNNKLLIIDLNNFDNQSIEFLLIACILEKKVNRLNMINLNNLDESNYLLSKIKWEKRGEIFTSRILSNSNYQITAQASQNQNKLLNLANDLCSKSSAVVLNANNRQYEFNIPFFKLANQIIVFADILLDASNRLIKLFLEQDLVDKNIIIFLYNYSDNIQNKKKYLEISKRFKSKNISIYTIDNIPNFRTLNEIENMDPWLDIYKKINSVL